jgi:replicative DNA helicase
MLPNTIVRLLFFPGNVHLQMAQRIISMEAEISSEQLRNGKLEDQDLEEISSSPYARI